MDAKIGEQCRSNQGFPSPSSVAAGGDSKLPCAGIESAAVVGGPGGTINSQNDFHGGSEGNAKTVRDGSYSSMGITVTIKARDGWNIRLIECQTNMSPLITETSGIQGARVHSS